MPLGHPRTTSPASIPTATVSAASSSAANAVLERENRLLKRKMEELQGRLQEREARLAAGGASGEKRKSQGGEPGPPKHQRHDPPGPSPVATPHCILERQVELLTQTAHTQLSQCLTRQCWEAVFHLFRSPVALPAQGQSDVLLGQLLFKELGAITNQGASPLPSFYILVAFLMVLLPTEDPAPSDPPQAADGSAPARRYGMPGLRG